jgi:hypothetical protein
MLLALFPAHEALNFTITYPGNLAVEALHEVDHFFLQFGLPRGFFSSA